MLWQLLLLLKRSPLVFELVIFLLLLLLLLFCFLGLHPMHVEVPRLGVESELQLPATATAMREPSCGCDLHHSSWQHQILNPLSKARDQTRVLMDPSQVRQPLSHKGTPRN